MTKVSTNERLSSVGNVLVDEKKTNNRFRYDVHVMNALALLDMYKNLNSLLAPITLRRPPQMFALKKKWKNK